MTDTAKQTGGGGGKFTFVTAGDLNDFKKPGTRRLIKKTVMDDYFRKNQDGQAEAPHPIQPGQRDVIKPASARRSKKKKGSPAEDKVADKNSQWATTEKGFDPEYANALAKRQKGEFKYESSPEESKLKLCIDQGGNLIPSDVLLSFLNYNHSPRAGRYERASLAVQPFRASSASTPLVYPVVKDYPYPFDKAYPDIKLSEIDFSDVDLSDLQLPRMTHPVGGVLDPYNTLPKSDFIKDVNVEYLKLHCSRVYGTWAMGRRWVPQLLRSRPAFLSTLAIAATHHDTMTSIYPAQSSATTLLKREVESIINNTLVTRDASNPIADFVIMSVVHLLAAGLPRGNHEEITWHENGISAMVSQRGGLQELGVQGELANVSTAIMLQSAVLRNARPVNPYRRFAARAVSSYIPPAPRKPIPENPLWSPRGEFLTLAISKLCAPITYELLCECRDLADTVFGSSSSSGPRALFETVVPRSPLSENAGNNNGNTGFYGGDDTSIYAANKSGDGNASPSSQDAQNRAARCRAIAARIDSYQSWDSPGCPGFGDAVYESCRLAARLFAAALSRGLSLPRALEALDREDATSGLPGATTQQYYSASRRHKSASPLLTALRSAIQRSSSLSDCWADHMTGVLYWISLVGAAAGAALPSPTATSQQQAPTSVHVSPDNSNNPDLPPSGVDVSWGAAMDDPVRSSGGTLAVHRAESGGVSEVTRGERRERKWLSALALRCCIVLIFQHPVAVLGTLGRMGGAAERSEGLVEWPQRLPNWG